MRQSHQLESEDPVSTPSAQLVIEQNGIENELDKFGLRLIGQDVKPSNIIGDSMAWNGLYCRIV